MDPVVIEPETPAIEQPPAITPLDSVFGSAPEGEKPSQEAKPEVKEAKAEEVAKEAAKETPTPEAQAKTEAEKPKEGESKTEWDSDDNPWKQKATGLEKQVKDGRDWTTTVQQNNVALKKQLEIIEKKLDGTYDPDTDRAPEPTRDQIELEAERKGRIAASEALAKQLHGKETIEQAMREFDEKFASNAFIQYRVLNAEAPVLEALKVLKQEKFVAKWSDDPEKIEKAIREDERQQMEKVIEEKVTKKVLARLNKKDETSQGIDGVRAAAPNGDGKTPFRPTPLTNVFGQ